MYLTAVTLLGLIDEVIIKIHLKAVLLGWIDKVIIRMHLAAVLLAWIDVECT